MKIIYFILLYFILFTSIAQESTSITGLVLFKKTVLEHVHVYNVHTQKGTISGKNGKFTILVSKGDDLHFSVIPYKESQVRITEEIMRTKKITINLVEDINTLDKVEVSNRKLVDNLLIASNNVPQDINTKFKIKIDNDRINYSQIPIYKSIEDRGLNEVDTKYNMMNIFAVIGLAINKIPNKKQKRNLSKSDIKIKIEKMPIVFRKQVGDSFFIKSLNINKPNIENFLNKYKNNKKFIKLFLENKILECMDFLIIANK